MRRHEDRIGNDISKKKFESTFLSRNIILKKLYAKKQFKKTYQKALIYKMLQAVKKVVFYKYDKLLLWQISKLFSVIYISAYKTKLIKIIFIYIPIYRITKRGETLFKL